MKYISLPFLIFFILVISLFMYTVTNYTSGDSAMAGVLVLFAGAILWPIAFGINLILIIKGNSKNSRARIDNLFFGLNILLTIIAMGRILLFAIL
jgi:hypothetical protein